MRSSKSPCPDEESRRCIFEVHLTEQTVGAGIQRQHLAADTDGFSGAEIQGVCTNAALRAVRRAVTGLIDKPEEASARC